MAAAPFAVAGTTVSVCDRLARGCTWCCSAMPVVGSGCTACGGAHCCSRVAGLQFPFLLAVAASCDACCR
eukprot:982599-Amphidinium_carterae.1